MNYNPNTTTSWEITIDDIFRRYLGNNEWVVYISHSNCFKAYLMIICKLEELIKINCINNTLFGLLLIKSLKYWKFLEICSLCLSHCIFMGFYSFIINKNINSQNASLLSHELSCTRVIHNTTNILNSNLYQDSQ